MTGAVEGGDCFLKIRRSLQALGFAAQLAQLRDWRPPCCSMRKGGTQRAFSFSSKAWRAGPWASPRKALLTRIVESDPRAGADPERSLLHSFLLE